MQLRHLAARFVQNGIDTDAPLRSLARWPGWLVRCALQKPVVARFATDGLRMRLTPRIAAFGSTSIFIKRDRYEPELLAIRQFIAPGDHILDIGASFGIYALFMSSYAGPNGRVHAFEPGAFSHAELTANVALNGRQDRIIVHRLAAAEQFGSLTLHHLGDSPVNFSVGAVDGVTSETIEAAPIDSVIPEPLWAAIRFIKIDVEGFERSAFRGLKGLIARALPVILFEVSAEALSRQGLTPRDVYDELAGYGYRFAQVAPNGSIVAQPDAVEGNILALPPGHAALAA